MVEGKSGKGFRPMGDQRSVAGSRAGTARCDWTFGGNVLFRRGNLDASRFPPAPLLQEAPRAKASPHQQRSGNRVAGKNPDLSGFLPGQKELRSGPCPHGVQRRNAGRPFGEIPFFSSPRRWSPAGENQGMRMPTPRAASIFCSACPSPASLIT